MTERTKLIEQISRENIERYDAHQISGELNTKEVKEHKLGRKETIEFFANVLQSLTTKQLKGGLDSIIKMMDSHDNKIKEKEIENE